MSYTLIERYLSDMKRLLWWQGLARSDILEEIAGHLYESVEDGLARGLGVDEAQVQALMRFGPANRVATQFIDERMTPVQKFMIAVAVVGGVFYAYVDSLPRWDDLGMLAFGILIFSGLIGLAGFRRPWLLGLAVGLWIPLHDILITQNIGSLLALVFALVGSYAGWRLNRLLRKSVVSA